MQTLRLDHGRFSQSNIHIVGDNNLVYGSGCRVTGNHNHVYGSNCTVVGNRNSVEGIFSRIIGHENSVSGRDSVVEGNRNQVSANRCTARGNDNRLSGDVSHAFGNRNTLSGRHCYAEGSSNRFLNLDFPRGIRDVPISTSLSEIFEDEKEEEECLTALPGLIESSFSSSMDDSMRESHQALTTRADNRDSIFRSPSAADLVTEENSIISGRSSTMQPVAIAENNLNHDQQQQEQQRQEEVAQSLNDAMIALILATDEGAMAAARSNAETSSTRAVARHNTSSSRRRRVTRTTHRRTSDRGARQPSDQHGSVVQCPTLPEESHDRAAPVAADGTPTASVCVVCQVNVPLCIALPCKHLAYCVTCARSLCLDEHTRRPRQRGEVDCSKCRRHVKEISRVFFE